MKKGQLFGGLLLLLTAFIWGIAFVFQRSGMESIEPLTFNASRMTLAAAAVGLVALWYRRKAAGTKRSESDTERITPGTERIVSGTERTTGGLHHTLVGGVICGAFLAGGSIFQQMGIVHTPAGKAGFITALYILLVPVISFVLFRKRNTWLVWLAVLMGVAGLYLLCMTERFSLSRGDVLICICAVMYSGHILCCDHFARRGNALYLSAVQFVVTALFSWGAAFLAESPGWDKILAAAVPILYCGIASGGLGYTLQMVAQKHTDPTAASLLMSLEAVFAAVGGVLILHERMTGRELLGCVIMFVAIILVQVPLPGKGKDSPHGQTGGAPSG